MQNMTLLKLQVTCIHKSVILQRIIVKFISCRSPCEMTMLLMSCKQITKLPKEKNNIFNK